MKYASRDLTHLIETEGDVVDYSVEGIPKNLQKTLRLSTSGISARMSGRRSALVQVEKEWYKLKGCNPQPGLFSSSDWFPELKGTLLDLVDPTWTKPKGSLCTISATTELEEQLKIVEKLGEFNLTAPLYPVARYDYAMENRACAVSITRGDLRLPEFSRKFSEKSYVLPGYKNQFNKIYQWLGFAQYITKESFGKLGSTSNGNWNYLFYETPKGYALMRTDFSHREESEKVLTPDFFGNVEQHVVDYLLQQKYSERVILRVLENLEIEIGDSKRAVSKRMDEYIVTLPEYFLPKNEKMMAYFQKGLDGEMPKPISKSFIESVWC